MRNGIKIRVKNFRKEKQFTKNNKRVQEKHDIEKTYLEKKKPKKKDIIIDPKTRTFSKKSSI